MSSINALYYSNECKGSQLLISMMQKERLTDFFHLICTDNNNNVPHHIKFTPTIIIKGVPTPYVAGDAFAWFARIKQWKNNTMMQKMSAMQQQYMKNINSNLLPNNNNMTNLLEFSKDEMEGMTDMFSHITSDVPLDRSFVDYKKIGTKALDIFTPPKEEDGRRLGNAKHKELHSKLEVDRKKQDVVIRKAIDDFTRNFKN
jgi:hypothetical protein